MSKIIQLRGHIRSDANYLTYEWHKKGSRFFPKALVSNAENILRFLSLGYRVDNLTPDMINDFIDKGKVNQKPYLLQVSVDYNQHHFLYLALHPIKTHDGQLSELLRIHDLWVLIFGLLVYENNPLKALAGDLRSISPKKGHTVNHDTSSEPRNILSLAPNSPITEGLSDTQLEDFDASKSESPHSYGNTTGGSSQTDDPLSIASVSSKSESDNKGLSESRQTPEPARDTNDTSRTSSGANGLKNLIRPADF